MTSSRTGTGTRATRVLGTVTLALFAFLVTFGLFNSPADAVQRDSVRILYLHVPSAEMAYVAFAVAAVASAAYLWRRTRSKAWDRVANASVELGVVFTGLTLLTGMMWGRISWGVYWDWADARLVSTLLLFVMFVGYLAVRRLLIGPEAEGVFTLFGIVFFLLGIALFGIGLLGEYIGRIYQQVRHRPRYLVEAILERK